MVTMKDIAQKLGIAVSTVSKGLNGANDISDELRHTIWDTAIAMGYTPKSMKKDSNKKLCVFIENIDYETPDSFGSEIILGFRQMAVRDGWNISVVPITPAFQLKERYDTYMLKNGFAGGFLLGLALHDEWIAQMHSTTVPSVLFDNYIAKNPSVSSIGTDSFEGIDLCISLLAELGHTRIAFLNGSANSMVTSDRQNAFFQSMKQNRLPIHENLTAFGYFTPDCAKYHVPAFLDYGATAIVCASDSIAQGVMEECELRGFHIPEDISITGFDDLPLASAMNPPLTTIRQDRILIGKCGYTTLAALMQNLPISRTVLRARLIQRASCAPVRPRAPLTAERRRI